MLGNCDFDPIGPAAENGKKAQGVLDKKKKGFEQ